MGDNPALVVRVAANLADLRANLAEGINQIETTSAAMGKLAASFSGDKLIQAAHNVTAAVNEIGGASKLTDAEMARVNATLERALEKYRVLGKDAPAGMQELANATKGVAETTKVATVASESYASQLGKINSLLGVFGVAISVGAVVHFGRSVLEAGDRIQKMADQTGLSTSEVQKFQYIAGQSGTSVESLVGAVQNLQQRLGDDNTGAAGAMAKLGIHTDAFNKLGTYTQMTTLAGAIRGIEDPTEQASLAAAIFGKTWKEILPAIKSGMQELGEQAPQMANDTVESLDRIGDALKRAEQQATAWGGETVLAIEKIGFALGGGLGTNVMLKKFVEDNDPSGLARAMEKIPPPVQAAAAAMDGLKLSTADITRIEKELTEAVNERGRKLREEQKASEAAAEEIRKVAELDEQALARHRAEVLRTTDAAVQMADAMVRAGEEAARAEQVATAETKRHNDELVKMKQLADAARAASRAIGGSSDVTSQNFAQQLTDLITTGGWNPSGIGSNIDVPRAYRYASQGYSFEEIVAIFAREKSGATGPIPPPQGPRIPGFAGGVQNAPGGWAMVGERGPETMYVPSGANIYPSGAGASPIVNHFHISISQPFGTPAAIAKAIDDSIMAHQRSIGTRF